MEVSTFDDDLLGLSDFSKRLERFIDVEHQFVSGSLVLALDSKFGSGKSTFLRMWRSELERREDKDKTPLVISLNAWESDYYGDPLFAIVSSLIESIQQTGKPVSSLVDAAKDVGWFATAIGGQIVHKFTGVDVIEAGSLAERKREVREQAESLSSDTFSMYQGRKKAMSNLQKAIAQFVADSKPRVIFLVDELDRCRPDYAISYLETIKHVFDLQGAVFILAADRHHLENAAKTAFGPNLDFEEYYRKFVHREVTLPPIAESGYEKLASAYTKHYLERDGIRNCIMNIDSNLIDRIIELISGLKLTPRQIQELFRILGHVCETSIDKRGRLPVLIAVGTLAMAAFKTGRPQTYRHLGSQQLDPREALQFLIGLFKNKHVEWWFAVLLSGGGMAISESEPIEQLLTRAGFNEEQRKSHEFSNLGTFHSGWGGRVRQLVRIYEMIEQMSQWN